MSGLSSFVLFVYFLCGSTNQRPPKFSGLSTFAKKKWFLACPFKRPPVFPRNSVRFNSFPIRVLREPGFFGSAPAPQIGVILQNWPLAKIPRLILH